MNAAFPDQVTADLKALLNGNTRADKRRAGIFHKGCQAFECLSVCKKIVDEKHPVFRPQKLLGYDDVIDAAVREALDS